jgi:hypothetical protein
MAEPDATQIVAGPGLLYVAPLGTALPSEVGPGEIPVVWPAGWLAVGYTEAGIDMVYTPSIKLLTVDEETAPVGDILTTEKFTIAAILAEVTLENLNRAISASSLTVDGVNGIKSVQGGSLALKYVMVGVQGPAPGTNKARTCILEKAISMQALSMKMQRTSMTTFPVTFDARKLSGRPLFEFVDYTSAAS